MRGSDCAERAGGTAGSQAEMGQGVLTSLPALLARISMSDWTQVQVTGRLRLIPPATII